MANQPKQATQNAADGENSASTSQAGSDLTDLQDRADTVKESAKTLLAQARSTAGDAYDSVVEKTTSKIDEQKAGLSGGLTTVADSIRKAADSLNGAGETNYVTEYSAQYAQTAADKVERVARYFETTDLKGIARDTEDFARRNPAVFLGGAFALGILVARLFKSSPAGSHEVDASSTDRMPYAGATGGSRQEAGLNAM